MAPAPVLPSSPHARLSNLQVADNSNGWSLVIRPEWSALNISRRYRRRFGIESRYRQFGSLRARTTSRNPALRFFLLALALLLRNIWLLLGWRATCAIVSGRPQWRPNAFRLSRFIAFLCRAIEHRYGTIDAIPIYSF